MNLRFAIASLLLLTSTACSGGPAEDAGDASEDALAERELDAHPGAVAVVRRTSHGIPHVLARDTRGLAFGMAEAYAEDNACLLADEILTVRGERSKFFGADESVLLSFLRVKNVDSDFFHRSYLQLDALRAEYDRQPADVRGLFEGYVAGYNHFLSRRASTVGEACGGRAWLRPMELDDMLRLVAAKSLLTSAGRFVEAIATAAPPAAPSGGGSSGGATTGEGTSSTPSGMPQSEEDWAAARKRFEPADISFGSNGVALGRDATDGGSGMLLGNPHFPWETTNRFYEVHFQVPGRIDVMGAAIGGFPVVSIGFNRDVAWTHTVSTALRFTPYELELAADDPTSYVKDGRRRPMDRIEIDIESKTTNGVATLHRTMYRAEQGAILVVPNVMPWTSAHAYALRDANASNIRTLEVWYEMARARSVQDVERTLGRVLGIPWVNTVAADRHGSAFYGDVGAVPNVTAETIGACVKSPTAKAIHQRIGVPVLDGSTSACDWIVDPSAARPGLMPASKMPAMVRSDYVANTNDSFWLPNSRAPLEGFSPILGAQRTQRSLRTRLTLQMLDERTQARMSFDALHEMFFENRLLAADMARDGLVSLCREDAGLAAARACDVLAAWDGRANRSSQGAVLFRETWRAAVKIAGLWRVPFDASNPLTTPRDLNVGDATVRGQLLAAMRDAVALLGRNGVALDARLDAVQFRVGSDGAHIPLSGGTDFEGGFNLLFGSALTPAGYPPQGSAVSYLQFVTWKDGAVRTDAVLAYGQSTDPASPYYDDQTRAYARDELVRLPFRDGEIRRDLRKTTALTE